MSEGCKINIIVNWKQIQLIFTHLMLWVVAARYNFTMLRRATIVNVSCSAVMVNPFRPEFIIVIFIHYKPRIAVAILDL